MAIVDDLVAARDRYAADLLAQRAPADYRWNEYEEFLVTQIEKLTSMIAKARSEDSHGQEEVISGGYT